jgi:hypothetical protein
MALNKDILGQALYDGRNLFANKTVDDLITEFGSLEAARLAAAKKDAEIIINHFKTAGVVTVAVNTTGTAAAQTGSGTGTIA